MRELFISGTCWYAVLSRTCSMGTVEYAYADWPKERLRLVRFDKWRAISLDFCLKPL